MSPDANSIIISKQYKTYLYLTLLIPVFIFLGRLGAGGFDITHFIVAGEHSILVEEHPYPIKIIPQSKGYDGMFFYQLALSPFITDGYEFGIQNNHLGYRKQRILYPFLAHFLAFRNPLVIPYTMVLVNIICVLITILLGYKMVIENNAAPYYILLIGGMLGMYIGLTRNLAETMEGMFLILTAYAFFHKKIFLFSLFSVCAILTRETAILIILPASGILIFEELKNKKIFSINYLYAILPLVVLVLWKAYLHWQLGTSAYNHFVWIPFKGIVDGQQQVLSGYLHPGKYNNYLHMAYGGYCIVYLIWIFITLITAWKKVDFRKDKFNQWVGLALLLWVGLAAILSRLIYSSDLSFGRVFNGIILLSFLLLIVNKVELSKLYLAFTLMLSFVVLSRIVGMT